MKLELGSGYSPTPGFVHLDANPNAPQVDIVGSATSLDQPDDSVTELRAVDVLEHLSYWDTDRVLAEWARVLRPGGKLYVQVPDAETIMQWFATEPDRLTQADPEGTPPDPAGRRGVATARRPQRWRAGSRRRRLATERPLRPVLPPFPHRRHRTGRPRRRIARRQPAPEPDGVGGQAVKYVAVMPYRVQDWADACLATCRLDPLLLVDNTVHNLGIMQSHNLGVDLIREQDADWLIILSAAVLRRTGRAGLHRPTRGHPLVGRAGARRVRLAPDRFPSRPRRRDRPMG